MPRKKKVVVMQGEGFMSFINGINKFLRKTKILSTVGKAVGSAIPIVGDIANAADKIGYGKPKARRKKGSGVRVAGAGVRVAGAGRKKKK